MSKKAKVVTGKLYKPNKLGSKKGTKIEMEHTPSKKTARIIAGGHEYGTPKESGNTEYYNSKDGLPAMEKKLKRKKGGKK